MALVLYPEREDPDRADRCTSGGAPFLATGHPQHAAWSAGEVLLVLVSTMFGTVVNFYLLTCWQAGEWVEPVPVYTEAWAVIREWWMGA